MSELELSYRPLTTRQFRVLRLVPGEEATPIHMTLQHVNLEDKPKFDALSYEWGPESTNTSEVFVNNKLFTIRHNLWLFLKRLRAFRWGTQVIYADAICINQRDSEEKGRQVALMSEIYMRAKRVLVWLGEHDETSELVFDTHFEIPQGVMIGLMMIPFLSFFVILGVAVKHGRRARLGLRRPDRVVAWRALLSRSYWNRTWIIQEFLLARSVVVFCGPNHMDRDLIFTRPLEEHFLRMMRENKGKLDGIPRSLLLYFLKRSLKHHGLFGKGPAYLANIDIFELAFNFQYTECQVMLDHVYGLLALEDLRKSPSITPNYSISAQMLFIDICMLKLPQATGSGSEVTDDGIWRVPKLFRGLRLTFDHAEEILDVLFDNKQYKTQNSVVIATIAKAFDVFGLLKPERKQHILPEASQIAEQIISVTRQWRTTQKENGNWYDLHHTAQTHEPPGMEYLQLDEPLWSHYSTLRDAAADSSNASNAADRSNMPNMNSINRITMSSIHQSTMNSMNQSTMSITDGASSVGTTGSGAGAGDGTGGGGG